jgi:hypothetical protein
MKHRSTLLFVIMIVTVTATFAQSKKDLEMDYAKCTAARDSIQKLHTGLSANYDSLNIAYESLNKTYDSINKTYLAYDSMYRVIKEKVILHDFDPEKAVTLLDSLKADRNETLSGITKVYSDSIAVLKEDIGKLQATNDSLALQITENAGVVNKLKQLKELLDAQIITQEEFDTRKATLLEKL